MLKLYKRTIIATAIVAVLSLTVAVLCEVVVFPHCGFVQNFVMGLLCSLIVVIVTTLLQYLHEHKKVLSEYNDALHWLITVIGLVFPGVVENAKAAYFDGVSEEIEKALERFRRWDKELIWFCAGKRKKQKEVYLHFARIWLDFVTKRISERKAAGLTLVHHSSYIPLIDAAIAFLPEGFDNDLLNKEKKWAAEALANKAVDKEEL